MPANDTYTSPDGKAWVLSYDRESGTWIATCGDLIEKMAGEGRMGLVVYLYDKYGAIDEGEDN